MRRIWIPQLVAGLMLLWALNPANPYGYYILLRWACCGIFAYLAVKGYEQGYQGWAWGPGNHSRRVQPDLPSAPHEGDLVRRQRRYNRYCGGVGLHPQVQGWKVGLTAITDPIIMGVVIHDFADRGTEDIFDGIDSRIARKSCPRELWPIARRKLDSNQSRAGRCRTQSASWQQA